MRLTRGRRLAWACGHKGFGSKCARCDQANDLETKANSLAQAVKTKAKELPAFVELSEKEVVVRAGAQRVSAGLHNNSLESALGICVAAMREHSTRLLKR
jgi:hypothetical protein